LQKSPTKETIFCKRELLSQKLVVKIHSPKSADMAWLRLVGSIKLQVSFAKEPYKRDDILQKRPVILSILLTVATPYVVVHSKFCSEPTSDNFGQEIVRGTILIEKKKKKNFCEDIVRGNREIMRGNRGNRERKSISTQKNDFLEEIVRGFFFLCNSSKLIFHSEKTSENFCWPPFFLKESRLFKTLLQQRTSHNFVGLFCKKSLVLWGSFVVPLGGNHFR